MKIRLLLLSSTLLLASTLHAQQQVQKPVAVGEQTQPEPQTTFQQQLVISSELMAVVTESALEPRSIGSYTVKVYAVAKPELAFDRFISGLVRPRDGSIEMAKTVDINLDGDKELVIVIRSAGSGGYLSADAFDINRTGLRLMASVSGLASNANPVSALTDKIRDQQQ